MSNKIIIKHGETVPTNTILDNFELGYCINDGLLYINNGSTIKKIGSDIATTINASSTNEKAAGDKAVYDFVTGGFTLNGNLILNANPTLNLQAATKEYVDNATSSIQDTVDTVDAIATNHAARHASDGADAITPASIGALPVTATPADIGAMAADATAADIGAATPAQLGSRSILHNGDWGHALVNQRARSGAVSDAYCIDRWIGSGTVEPVSGQHVTLAAGTVMTQRLEILPAALAGREMTFSIDVGGTVQTANIPFPASVTAAAATAALTDVSVSLGFHDLGSGNSSLLCGVASRYIPFVRLTAGAAIHVRRVFLEPGSVSTMENTLPQDYAAELARCERYYRILPANVFFGLATSSTSVIQGVVPYEQKMRASGTASCASTETLVYSGTFAFIATSSATVFTSLVQGLEIVCTVTPAACAAYRYTGLAFNAPILISSDL